MIRLKKDKNKVFTGINLNIEMFWYEKKHDIKAYNYFLNKLENYYLLEKLEFKVNAWIMRNNGIKWKYKSKKIRAYLGKSRVAKL